MADRRILGAFYVDERRGCEGDMREILRAGAREADGESTKKEPFKGTIGDHFCPSLLS
jgi:hypothetical protein